MKRFIQWSDKKEDIDSREHIPPRVYSGDMWWCSIGKNIGTEVYGKGVWFTRPVVIIKKFNKYSFLVVPVSTKQAHGFWQVSFGYSGMPQTALLNQVRTINYKRLGQKMGSLKDSDVKKIKETLARLLLSDSPR